MLAEKVAATQEVASAFTFNAIKSAEYDPGAATSDLAISLGALGAERAVNMADGGAEGGGCAALPRMEGLAIAGLLAALSRRRVRSRPSDLPRR